MSSYSQVFNYPFFYGNGMVVSNHDAVPNSRLYISAGQVRDSTNTFDMNLGNFTGIYPSLDSDTVTTLDALTVGANGIDTGALAASKVYSVYVISNPLASNQIATLLSLSDTPLLPFEYSTYQKIGYAVTDSSSNFLLMKISGDRDSRTLLFDAPQATAVTAGNATIYTVIDLSAFVPLIDKTLVHLTTAFTPGAASRTLKLQPAGNVGDAVTITGQVTSVVVTSNVSVQQGPEAADEPPKISYKVSNAGDAAAINVAGFDFYI